jgi:glyoxylase-like metal-dependent hydrolase (beta-lactamase superfamily II)
MLIHNPPQQITENLWMLGTNEYPLYLYCGESEGAIFEGGTGAMGPVLRGQLEGLSVAADFVKQVIVTHGHPDHVMAVPMFRELFPGVAVLASQKAADAMAAEKAVAFFCQVDEALTGAMLKAGRIEEKHRPKPLADKQIAVDRVLQEGDRVAVDEASFEVLATPGHSECSLSFYEPQAKILVISDATGYYLPESGYWWPNYFSDYGAYLASMRRLAKLEADALLLSHNAAITGAEDIKAYFDGAIRATEEYHERILADRKAGKPVREIAESLGAEVHEKTQLLPLDFFQKNCGLLVKLSCRHAGVEG